VSRPRTVRYGDDAPDQVADLWLPDGTPRGVVVSLHGGYFRAVYARDLHDPLAAELARRGYAVWNVEYRRTGAGGGFDPTTADVLTAVDALAGLDGLPPGPAVAIGHSAGGYLACFLAAHPRIGRVVSMGGIAHPRDAVRAGWDNGAVAAWMGAGPDDDPERYAAADLAARAPTATPHVLLHGTEDEDVPATESRRLAEELAAAGDPVQLVELPGEGHFGFLDPAHPAALAALDAVAGE